jgi:hypothetical protein
MPLYSDWGCAIHTLLTRWTVVRLSCQLQCQNCYKFNDFSWTARQHVENTNLDNGLTDTRMLLLWQACSISSWVASNWSLMAPSRILKRTVPVYNICHHVEIGQHHAWDSTAYCHMRYQGYLLAVLSSEMDLLWWTCQVTAFIRDVTLCTYIYPVKGIWNRSTSWMLYLTGQS